MLIVSVVIASFIVLSSAQSTAKQCNTTYNSIPQSCRNASTSISLSVGTATPEQRKMVCDTSQVCNGVLKNVTRDCGNMVRKYKLQLATYIHYITMHVINFNS